MAARTFDLVVVANRLPVVRVSNGWQRSPGGLVTALEPAVRGRDAAWVGWPGTAGHAVEPFDLDRLHLCPVRLSTDEVVRYYEGFSNATVWPLFHDLVVPVAFHRSWWRAYRDVNERFAASAAGVVAAGGTVWVQDYHLQLVPGLVRAERPDVRIGWFDHIPFPPVELFAELPWRRELVTGLLGADFLGFQSVTDAGNFLRVCRRLLGLPTTPDAVALDGRTARVGAIPVSVDFAGLDALAREPDVATAARKLRASFGDPRVLVLGYDRLDYTKGIRHRLKAYDELLHEGVVRPPETLLVQVALPSRERVPVYRALADQVEAAVRRTNRRYARDGCPAVRLSHERFTPHEAAALFRAADVLLVTPLRDGMNLVAKEYVAGRPDLAAALVLSEFAGAAHELPEAFLCNPHDIDGLKRAMRDALAAPEEEKRRRMRALRRHVGEHDVQWWANTNLRQLA